MNVKNKIKNKIINSIGIGKFYQLKYWINLPGIQEIVVDISASCNARCPMCPRIYMPEERSKGFMSLELFEYSLSEAKKNGINLLRLYSTAEPTLHPDFEKIIDMA